MPKHEHLPAGLFAFVWHFLRHYRLALVVFFFTSVFWSFEMSFSPYLLKLIIDGANQHSASSEGLLAAIGVPMVLYASMSLLMNLVFRVYGYTALRVFPKIKEDVTTSVFRYLSEHSYRYFQENFAGTLTSKISDLTQGVEQVILIPEEMFIPRSMAILFAAFMLALVDPVFSMFLFAWVICFAWVTYRLSKRTEPYAIKYAEYCTVLNGQLTDSLSNIVTSKMFAGERYENTRIRRALDSVVETDRAMQWKIQIAHFIQGLMVTVLIAGMLMLLVHERLNNNVTVGDFAFVLGISITITMTIWDVGQQMIKFTKEVGKCKQALGIIAIAHEIADNKDAVDLKITQGNITFEKVNFRYNDNNETFDNLSVHINAGEKVGLVGFSGGGKSSFVKLIMRLYDIQSGSIKIDNEDIKQVTKASLRSQIAMIPQEPEMFHRSIMDNIRYGKQDATLDEVIDAAKKAHCHEFIESLEEGYKTLVGERGVKLSGGQRQRIAIARAILKQAPILIMDEATSALDSQTERYIQQSLHDMMQGKTTIVIAHRLSTLLEMDRILFFKDGEIIEDGDLKTLREGDGPFATLWRMQGDGYLPDVGG